MGSQYPDGMVPLCPTCGERCAGLDTDADYREVFPQEEVWPGGPKVEATWLLPRSVLTGTRFTFHPCGHAVMMLPGEELRITFEPKGS